MITGLQLKTARFKLRLTTRQLAGLSTLDESLLVKMEAFDRNPIEGYEPAIQKVIAALHSEGLEFIDNRGEKGLGLQFRRSANL